MISNWENGTRKNAPKITLHELKVKHVCFLLAQDICPAADQIAYMTGQISVLILRDRCTAEKTAAAEQLTTSAVASRIRQSANQHLKTSK